MTVDRNRKYQEMANRGKYQRLYTHLYSLTTQERRITSSDTESVIGF